MATDTVKVLKGRTSPVVLGSITEWIHHALSSAAQKAASLDPVIARIQEAWGAFKQRVMSDSQDELTANGRDVIAQLGNIVCSVLLTLDAVSDSDKTSEEILLRFVEDRLKLERPVQSWTETSELDGLIAFGHVWRKFSSKL